MTNALAENLETMTHEQVVAVLDKTRRIRVRREDRRRRLLHLLFACLLPLPCIWMIWLYGAKDELHDPISGEFLMVMISMSMSILAPVELVKAILPAGESRRRRRRLPTFVPQPAMLDKGGHGRPWAPDREDVVFDRIQQVVRALNSRDGPKVKTSLISLTRRACELCGADDITTPSPESRYHYWLNRKTENGIRDGETIVTCEDNHPIQHQVSRLKETVEDLRTALNAISIGVDRTDTSIAMRDVITVLRRVVELRGYDASPLRAPPPKVVETAPIITTDDGPGADVIAYVRKALQVDPDLKDDLGNPIAPLLTTHVPRLIETYHKAIDSVRESERAGVEQDLHEGLELVRRAAEEGLARHGAQRRQEMRNEISFLRARGTSGLYDARYPS